MPPQLPPVQPYGRTATSTGSNSNSSDGNTFSSSNTTHPPPRATGGTPRAPPGKLLPLVPSEPAPVASASLRDPTATSTIMGKLQKAIGDILYAAGTGGAGAGSKVSQTNEEADFEFVREALRGSKLMQYAQAEHDEALAMERADNMPWDNELEHDRLEHYSNMEGFENADDFNNLKELPGWEEDQVDNGDDLGGDDRAPDNDDDLWGDDQVDNGDDLWTDDQLHQTLDDTGLDEPGLDGTGVYLAGWETQVPGLKPDAGLGQLRGVYHAGKRFHIR